MAGTRRDPGSLGPFVEGYRAWLVSRGFTAGTVRGQLKVLGQVGRWMPARGLTVADLDAEALQEFRADRLAAGYRRVPGRLGLSRLLDFLHDAGAVEPSDDLQHSELDDLLADYRSWLTTERGLAEPTIHRYVRLAGVFLSDNVQPDGRVDTAGLTGGAVNQFLLVECRRLCVGSAKGRVAELRALLRWLHLRGLTDLPLGEAVPPVAGWRDTAIPATLTRDQVQALLEGCDRSTPTGIRDFAIMTLLARLGLRSIEVARLALDDVDWRAGDLLVRGKARRVDRLPLPVQVGQALADYLVSARPTSEDRHLFLTVKAPIRPVPADLCGDVVRRACSRTGLPEVGAHRLRHALATQMLAAGAALAEVSQVLRHSDLATTAVYAKVDLRVLRELARPWPTIAGAR